MTLRNGQSNGSIRAWRRYFPLNSVDDVVDLMREFVLDAGIQPSSRPLHPPPFPSSAELFKPDENTPPELSDFRGKEPNLAFVSTILGYIENYLTVPTQDSLSTRKSRSNSALGSRLSPLITSMSSSKVVSPSPLSVQVDSSCSEADHFLHTAISSSDTSPLSTVSSSTTTATMQNSTRTTKRPRHFSGSSGTSRRLRRVRHTSSSSPIASSVCDTNESASRPESPCSLPPLLAMDSATSKRRRLSETSLSSSLLSSRTDKFPRLTFDDVEQLYREFYNLIVTSPLLSSYIVDGNSTTISDRQSAANRSTRWATRDLIRTVLQVLWNRMAGAGRGRDRLTHTQSIYSFLTTGLLDSFGLAYTIVAACQLLGYSDVDLALSEDHGWVEFGPPDDRQTADVASWVHQCQQQHQQLIHQSQHQQQHHQQDHQLQQLRLPSIREPPLNSSWLYVNSQPVICRPHLVAMAAAVAAMQPGGLHDLLAPSLMTSRHPLADGSNAFVPDVLSSGNTPVSYQLVHLKHRLLWLLYASGCLTRYPLGLTNLADLEDTFPTTNGETTCSVTESPSHHQHGRQETTTAWPLALYKQAVLVNQRYYNNQHVYPYTCLAGCFYRRNRCQEALRNWCEAACVIGQYKHSSEDLEVYRELLEIATNWMPQIFRSAAEAARSCSEGLVEADPDGSLYQPHNILDNPQCLAHLISFYDHLCLWEECASVPVLHVGWVDKLMVNLARFSQRARRHLYFNVPDHGDDTIQPQVTPTASVTSSSWSSRCRSRSASMRPLSVDTSIAAVGDHLSPLAAKTSPIRLRKGSVYSSQGSVVKTRSSGVSPSAVYTRTLTVCASPLSMESDSNVRISATPTPLFCPDKDDQQHTTTEVLLVSTKPREVDDTSWHLLPTTGAEVPSPTLLLPPVPVACNTSTVNPTDGIESTTEAATGLPASTNGGDDDASPSPPPLSIFPGEEEVDDTEELLFSLAEACDRRLLNPAFLSGSEPNVPFLPADCELDEVFARLVASWDAENSNRQTMVPVKSSSDLTAATTTVTEGAGASIFPTPPSSGGISEPQNLAALLSCPQPQELKFEAHYLPDTKKLITGESELNDAEDAAAIHLFHDMFESVSTSTSVAEPQYNDKQTALTEIAEGEAEEPVSPIPLPGPHASKSLEDLAVHLSLRSIKMISIVELLRAPRLNSSAIKLALTAQSQVSLRRTSATVAAASSPYAL